MASIKMSRHIQTDFIAFLKVFESLSMCATFQVNKKQFPIEKKNMMGIMPLPSSWTITRSKYVAGNRFN